MTEKTRNANRRRVGRDRGDDNNEDDNNNNDPSQQHLYELHVYVWPEDTWVEPQKLGFAKLIDMCGSAGFIRVSLATPLGRLREEIFEQLGDFDLPEAFVFLRLVGRCLTQVKVVLLHILLLLPRLLLRSQGSSSSYPTPSSSSSSSQVKILLLLLFFLLLLLLVILIYSVITHNLCNISSS